MRARGGSIITWGVIMLACTHAVSAQQRDTTAGLHVREAVVVDSIVNQRPAGRVQCRVPNCWTVLTRRLASDSARTLYLWSDVTGGGPGRYIEHVWYRDEREVSRVRLPVSSASWRTWSRAIIPPHWVGDGRVDVLSDNGALITERRFRFEAIPLPRPPVSLKQYDRKPIAPIPLLVQHLETVVRIRKEYDAKPVDARPFSFPPALVPKPAPGVTLHMSDEGAHWSVVAMQQDRPGVVCTVWGGTIRRADAWGKSPLAILPYVVQCYAELPAR